LLAYAATAKAEVFHVLWNNKLELFDRTLLLSCYKLLGKRVVFTVHNVNIRKRDGRDSVLNRGSLRIQYRLVDHLFVHTRLMARELQDDFGVPGGKITVIPFGINNTVPVTPMTGGQARERLGLAPTDKAILFFGNIAKYKGLEHLVEAMPAVLTRFPEARLVIAGRPKGAEAYWADIERRIADLKLQASVVTRIEYVPDEETEVYFKAADVLVLPYTHVYQSGVLFLGYNFGTPAIATDVGSLREEVVDGETGFICPAEDHTALAHSIVGFFASELFREREAARDRIRAYAAKRYAWSEVAALTTRVYGAVGAPPRAGAGSPQDEVPR